MTTFAIPISVGPLYRHPAGEPEGVQHDPDTATRWTLHLRCGDTLDDVRVLADRIWASAAHCLYAYWGGDLFAAWGEPFDGAQNADNPGRALHVEFYAPDRDGAVQVGEALARAAGITSAVDAKVTTTATHDHWFECLPLALQRG